MNCTHPNGYKDVEGHGYILADDASIRVIWTMCCSCGEIVTVRLDDSRSWTQKEAKPDYL